MPEINSIFLNTIGNTNNVNFTNTNTNNTKLDENAPSFKSVFENMIEKTNQTDKIDEQSNFELMTGNLENMHDAVIKAQEAELALSLTVQIRNKIVDAYNEIMRMQV